MMIPLLLRHGTFYVRWSAWNSRVPFVELARVPGLRELDFGWWRIHLKIDWRSKGWNEAQHRARLSQWWG
jgi:hypothetical protein